MTNSVELVFQIQKGSQGHKLIADVVLLLRCAVLFGWPKLTQRNFVFKMMCISAEIRSSIWWIRCYRTPRGYV